MLLKIVIYWFAKELFVPLRYFYDWSNVVIKADSTEKHLNDPVSFKQLSLKNVICERNEIVLKVENDDSVLSKKEQPFN